MPMNPEQMASGQPQPQGMTTAAPGNTSTTQITQVIDALKKVLQQAVTQDGYVDVQRLIQMWPQFSQIPFQVVMQLIQQNPEILNELISQYGLAGIMINGRKISADELAGIGTGAMGKGGGV